MNNILLGEAQEGYCGSCSQEKPELLSGGFRCRNGHFQCSDCNFKTSEKCALCNRPTKYVRQVPRVVDDIDENKSAVNNLFSNFMQQSVKSIDFVEIGQHDKLMIKSINLPAQSISRPNDSSTAVAHRLLSENSLKANHFTDTELTSSSLGEGDSMSLIKVVPRLRNSESAEELAKVTHRNFIYNLYGPSNELPPAIGELDNNIATNDMKATPHTYHNSQSIMGSENIEFHYRSEYPEEVQSHSSITASTNNTYTLYPKQQVILTEIDSIRSKDFPEQYLAQDDFLSSSQDSLNPTSAHGYTTSAANSDTQLNTLSTKSSSTSNEITYANALKNSITEKEQKKIDESEGVVAHCSSTMCRRSSIIFPFQVKDLSSQVFSASKVPNEKTFMQAIEHSLEELFQQQQEQQKEKSYSQRQDQQWEEKNYYEQEEKQQENLQHQQKDKLQLENLQKEDFQWQQQEKLQCEKLQYQHEQQLQQLLREQNQQKQQQLLLHHKQEQQKQQLLQQQYKLLQRQHEQQQQDQQHQLYLQQQQKEQHQHRSHHSHESCHFHESELLQHHPQQEQNHQYSHNRQRTHQHHKHSHHHHHHHNQRNTKKREAPLKTTEFHQSECRASQMFNSKPSSVANSSAIHNTPLAGDVLPVSRNSVGIDVNFLPSNSTVLSAANASNNSRPSQLQGYTLFQMPPKAARPNWPVDFSILNKLQQEHQQQNVDATSERQKKCRPMESKVTSNDDSVQALCTYCNQNIAGTSCRRRKRRSTRKISPASPQSTALTHKKCVLHNRSALRIKATTPHHESSLHKKNSSHAKAPIKCVPHTKNASQTTTVAQVTTSAQTTAAPETTAARSTSTTALSTVAPLLEPPATANRNPPSAYVVMHAAEMTTPESALAHTETLAKAIESLKVDEAHIDQRMEKVLGTLQEGAQPQQPIQVDALRKPLTEATALRVEATEEQTAAALEEHEDDILLENIPSVYISDTEKDKFGRVLLSIRANYKPPKFTEVSMCDIFDHPISVPPVQQFQFVAEFEEQDLDRNDQQNKSTDEASSEAKEAHNLILDRAPLRCPDTKCDQSIFVSDFCQHLLCDHFTVPLERIESNCCKTFFCDARFLKKGTSRCLMCFFIRDKIKNISNSEFKDYLPIMVMTSRVDMRELCGFGARDTRKRHEHMIFWVTGLVPEKLTLTCSLAIWQTAGKYPGGHYCLSNEVYPLRCSQHPKDVWKSGCALLLHPKEIYRLSRACTEMINLQLVIH